MRIQLLKGWTWKWRKYPIGKIVTVMNSLANKLIDEKIGREYTGEYPPKTKMKTNFFKQ